MKKRLNLSQSQILFCFFFVGESNYDDDADMHMVCVFYYEMHLLWFLIIFHFLPEFNVSAYKILSKKVVKYWQVNRTLIRILIRRPQEPVSSTPYKNVYWREDSPKTGETLEEV